MRIKARLPGRPRGDAPARLCLLVLAILAGLVWMHALSGSHHTASHSTHPHPAVAHGTAAVSPCPEVYGSPPCPPHRPGRHSAVCESAAVPNPFVVALPASLHAGTQVDPGPNTAVVPATEAGTGTGCGPPSLTMLSISRT